MNTQPDNSGVTPAQAAYDEWDKSYSKCPIRWELISQAAKWMWERVAAAAIAAHQAQQGAVTTAILHEHYRCLRCGWSGTPALKSGEPECPVCHHTPWEYRKPALGSAPQASEPTGYPTPGDVATASAILSARQASEPATEGPQPSREAEEWMAKGRPSMKSPPATMPEGICGLGPCQKVALPATEDREETAEEKGMRTAFVEAQFGEPATEPQTDYEAQRRAAWRSFAPTLDAFICALSDANIISPDAYVNPDAFDGGQTLERCERAHRMLFEPPPPTDWPSVVSPPATDPANVSPEPPKSDTPEPQYRMLEPGEIIQEGDEFEAVYGWGVTGCAGSRISASVEFRYRRRIAAPTEPQTTTKWP